MDLSDWVIALATMSNASFAFKFGLVCIALAIVRRIGRHFDLSIRQAVFLGIFGACIALWGSGLGNR